MFTTHRIGTFIVTLRPGPLAFLGFAIVAVLLVVFFAPPENAAIVLAPSGIFGLIVANLMREAFKIERAPTGEPEPVKSEEGSKPDA